MSGFEPSENEQPVELPIDGVLDLHTFKPEEIGSLIPAYLEACQQHGIFKIRIIHGKGIGNLRRSVNAILARHPDVISFTLANPMFGGWGATVVSLKPKTS